MKKLVRCPACGIKTSDTRERCPKCGTPLVGAVVIARMNVLQVPTAAEIKNISALFPKRKRFGVADFLLLAGLVACTVLASDLRLWVQGGLSAFGATVGLASAATGSTRAELSPSPDAVETARPDPGGETDAPQEEPATTPAPVPVPHAELMGAGNRAFDAGDFETARTHFTDAAAGTPSDPRAHNNLGQALVRLGEGEAALVHLEEAVRLEPGRWAYHFNLAHALGEEGLWNRAAAQYRQAIQLRPDDPSGRYNLARALHEWGEYRSAVESYLEAIALAPHEPRFFFSIARSYESMDRPADAMAAYTRYLEIEPESEQAENIRQRIEELAAFVDLDASRLAGS
ncbi:MAG: tetratricopeptide repeat protein [Acidobacteria bacterium]|nr:tetratricopeptide repeat protein [Acidobacteriota bacterium]